MVVHTITMALIINMVKTVVRVVVHLVEISRMVVREPLVKVMMVPVTSNSTHRPSGGGGASESGTYGVDSSKPADGGDGKSSDILGTTYWWSGGGGGANHHAPKGGGGKGGGGSGAWGHGSSAVGGSSDTNGVSDAEPTPGSDNNWHQRGAMRVTYGWRRWWWITS